MNIQNDHIQAYPGWMGNIDHIRAEKYLLKQKPGTYLLREGDFITKSIENELETQGHQAARCYILTVVEEEKTIKDFMIIQLQKGWLLYNDDPDLYQDQYQIFQSLKDLLNTLEGEIKYPIQI